MTDYSLITPTKIELRFLSSPDEIKEFLLSDEITKVINRAIRTHFLDENKAAILQQLVTLVLLGFISPNDFNFEIAEQMFLNHTHANILAKEFEGQFFHPLKDLLEKNYKPLSKTSGDATNEVYLDTSDTTEEETGPEEKTITFAGLGREAAEPEEKLPITVSEKSPAEEGKSEENPFILQEEKPAIETSQPFLKKFSFSLGGFFGKKKEEQQPEKPVKAKIELFGGPKEDKEKRVVHYSELRTPLGESVFKPVEAAKTTTPAPTAPEAVLSGGTQGNGSAKKAPWSFKWFGAQAPARDEQKSVPVHEAVGAPAEETKEKQEDRLPKAGGEETPHLEGNTIDLRK